MERSKELSMDQAFLQKLTDSVFDNLTNEQFGAEELASNIGMSRSQIHRKLQKINGQSVTQFIREIRLKEAHRLLEENVGTASKIAYRVGFGSPTYFSNCFHEFYGYTPGEVKQRINETTNSPTPVDVDKTRIFKIDRTSDHPDSTASDRKNWLFNSKKAVLSAIAAMTLALVFYMVFKDAFNNIQQEAHGASVSDRSIAVIPFEFLGQDSTYNYYSSGMVTEILNHLYKIGELEVKSDVLSKKFADTRLTAKEIGRAFDVSHILTGSVLTAGEAVRITPRLIDAQTNDLLWSESFTGSLSNVSEIIAIQSEVAKKVALECKASISPEAEELIQGRHMPDNNLAYEFYLKGKDYWNSRGDFNLAIEMYSKAIAADASFAAAFARRSTMHAEAYWAKRSDNWLDHDPLALADIQKAMQLDPTSLEAKFAQSVYKYYIDRDYEEALNILDDLKKKMPNMAELHAYSAWVKRRQGKWHESIIENEKAIQLEPFNVSYILSLGASYRTLRQFDMAIEVYRMGLERVPDYELFRKRIVKAVRKKTGNMDFALEVAGLEEEDMQFYYYLYTHQFDKMIDLVIKENRSLSGPNNFHPNSHELAHAYHYVGDTVMSKIYADSAIQLLEKKLAENPLDHRLQAPLSKCYAFMGDREKAIYYGKESVRVLPVEVDALRGIGRENELLKTYVFLGDYNLAFDKIEYLLSVPGFLTVGDLWLKPEYYPLRKFPRFHEILRAHQPDSLYQIMVKQGL